MTNLPLLAAAASLLILAIICFVAAFAALATGRDVSTPLTKAIIFTGGALVVFGLSSMFSA
jgi:hypothetical protein